VGPNIPCSIWGLKEEPDLFINSDRKYTFSCNRQMLRRDRVSEVIFCCKNKDMIGIYPTLNGKSLISCLSVMLWSLRNCQVFLIKEGVARKCRER